MKSAERFITACRLAAHLSHPGGPGAGCREGLQGPSSQRRGWWLPHPPALLCFPPGSPGPRGPGGVTQPAGPRRLCCYSAHTWLLARGALARLWEEKPLKNSTSSRRTSRAAEILDLSAESIPGFGERVIPQPRGQSPRPCREAPMTGRLRAGRPGSPGTRAQCGGPTSCTIPSLTERPTRASPAGVDLAPAGPALRAGGQILNQGASLDSRPDWQVEFGVGGYTWSRRSHYGDAPDQEVLGPAVTSVVARGPLRGWSPVSGSRQSPRRGLSGLLQTL